VAPARPGAFNANFAPDTLTQFKELCKQQGKQYTKVLERLADLYLESNGDLLEALNSQSPSKASHAIPPSSSIESRGSTVKEMLDRLEQLETNDREFASAFEILLHRVEALEGKLGNDEEN